MGFPTILFGDKSSSHSGSLTDYWNQPSITEVLGGDDLTVKQDCDDCTAAPLGETSKVSTTVATSHPSPTLVSPCPGAYSSPRLLTTQTTPCPLSMLQRWESLLAPAKRSTSEETTQQHHKAAWSFSSKGAEHGWVFITKPRGFQLLRRKGSMGVKLNPMAAAVALRGFPFPH